MPSPPSRIGESTVSSLQRVCSPPPTKIQPKKPFLCAWGLRPFPESMVRCWCWKNQAAAMICQTRKNENTARGAPTSRRLCQLTSGHGAAVGAHSGQGQLHIHHSLSPLHRRLRALHAEEGPQLHRLPKSTGCLFTKNDFCAFKP